MFPKVAPKLPQNTLPQPFFIGVRFFKTAQKVAIIWATFVGKFDAMNFQKSHIQVTVFVTLLLLLRSMCSFLYLFGSVCASFCFLTSWYRTDAACLLAGCNTFTKHQRRLEQKTDRAIGAQNLILAKMFPRLDQCQTIRRACFWGQ